MILSFTRHFSASVPSSLVLEFSPEKPRTKEELGRLEDEFSNPTLAPRSNIATFHDFRFLAY